MRQLWPTPLDDIDLADRYGEGAERAATSDRPWVVINMITTVDGATAVDGVSGALGGPGDKAVFRQLRSVPDVILVGAATVRAERYGPPRPNPEARQQRVRRGQTAAPRLAVVSGRLDLDGDERLFAEAEEAPIVYTIEAPPSAVVEGACPSDEPLAATSPLEEVADVVRLHGPRIDVADVLADLHARGVTVVLCEGGPSVNGQLVAAGLVDEWCLTLAPMLAAGSSPRPAHGPLPTTPEGLHLAHVLADDEGYLFLRYTARA